MSHYQSKGDRSEAQLKKAGRTSGPGHQRSGVPSTAAKGGGAGGPSPSSSAPPTSSSSLSVSHSFPAGASVGASSGRPSTPGSSNRGGKRGNGPAGQGRNPQSGGPTDHGGYSRNAQYSGSQYQQPLPPQQVSSVRQGLGSTDAHQHPSTITGQHSELKQLNPPANQPSNPIGGSRVSSTGGALGPFAKQPTNAAVPGAASKPPAPVVPSSTVSFPDSTASSIDTARTALQPSFSFQFGSITPGFMNSGPGIGMQIPARTSSAPPNLDEQKREQARFEASRAAVVKKVPTVPSGHKQVQATRGLGNASELFIPVSQSKQVLGPQGPLSGVGSAAVLSQQQAGSQAQVSTPPPVQYTQGQGQSIPVQGHGPQHSHAPAHMPAQVQASQHLQHQLAAAHSQAQAHTQQQQQALAQQAMPQQSLPQPGLVQQSQGIKFPQSMMPPHGTQIIPQQMGNSLGGQLSSQQLPPQMAHQLGSQMGGQLQPGISGTQYGSPAPIPLLQPQRSRPVKIVNPDTLEELRFDAKTRKGEPHVDAAPSIAAGIPVRVSSNGPPRPGNYGSGPHHGMVPNMKFYPQIQNASYVHAAPPFYQSAPSKNVSVSGGPLNTPSLRYGYGPQTPFMSHPGGASSNSPASKVGLAGTTGGGLGGTDMVSGSPSPPLVVSPAAGPPHPIIAPPLSFGRAATISPALQSVPIPATDARASTAVTSSAAGYASVVPLAPTSNAVIDLKFGDMETSGSQILQSSGVSPADSLPAPPTQADTMNGITFSPSPGMLSQVAPMTASERSSPRIEQLSRTSVPAVVTPGPSLTLPPSKPAPTSYVISPRSSAGSPSSVPPVAVDRPKIEILKPATTSREISRKISKKEQKQHKQHLVQPPLATVPLQVESEWERLGEAITSSSSGGNLLTPPAISVSTGATARITAVKPDLVDMALKIPSPFSKSEDENSAASTESEKLSIGNSSGPSFKSSEVMVAASLSDKLEEVPRKSISKETSSIVPTSVNNVDAANDLITDPVLSSGEDGIYSKVNSSYLKVPSGSPLKEPEGGRLEEFSSVQKGPGAQVPPQVLEVPRDRGATSGISAKDSLSARHMSELDDLASETDDTLELVIGSGVLLVEGKSLLMNTKLSNAELRTEAATVGEVTNQDVLASKVTDSSLNSRTDFGDLVKEPAVVPLDVTSDTELLIPKDRVEVTEPLSSIALIDMNPAVYEDGQSDLTGEGPVPTHPFGVESSVSTDSVTGMETEVVKVVETPLSRAIGQNIEECNVDDVLLNSTPTVTVFDSKRQIGIIDNQGIPSAIFSDSESESHGNLVKGDNSPVETQSLLLQSQNLTGVVSVTDLSQSLSNGNPIDLSEVPHNDGVLTDLVSKHASESQYVNSQSAEVHNPRESPDSTLLTSSNSRSEPESFSTSAPEVKLAASKKKKKKEIFAKADAQGPTADLFTAYKAPEDKKLDDLKRAEVLGSPNHGSDLKKDSLSGREKPVVKELDDWEDAAELPTPKSGSILSSATPNVALVSSDVPRKYTKDYLLSQREFHKELPQMFEIRADIEQLLNSQPGSFVFIDSLPSPGRGLDRQSSGGPRLDRRNSNNGMEEDRWTRHGGPVASPGRGAVDARAEMVASSATGGFRPGGQGTNTGLMRMPPGMRTGQPGIMPVAGVLPGVSLLPQHMMMPAGLGRSLSGVDADRWHRAPAGQKGLIPSPRAPLPAIHRTENRYQVGKVSDEEQQKQRLIKGILNKLTPQNFDKLFTKVKEVNIDTATTLTGVISQIFDKALTEPTFCEMYAKFCVQLAVELPEFVEEEEKITFKRVLLNKCQEEFERGEREQEEAEKAEEEGEVKLTAEEREEKRTSARRRMLGNIRFIGELYKKNMLTERIMHECIKKLLGEYQNPDEEDVEALCKLMSTIGRIIDHLKAKEHIDAYFKRMEMLSENLKLSSRLRFMLKDVIDLRRNQWQERRKVEGPKKIDEVHRDAVQERQQAAASGRDRLQQRGGMVLPGRRTGNDFAMRGPQSPMFSPGTPGGIPVNGSRGPHLPATMRGGFVQDVRMQDHLLNDVRPIMTLSQRTSDDGPLTLGPQGGLGRGMGTGMRQPLGSGRSVLADVPPGMLGDGRRLGPVPFPIPDRSPYGGREEIPMRGLGIERPLGAVDRPLLERPLGTERLGPPLSGRDMRVPDRSSAERQGISGSSSVSLRPLTPPAAVAVQSAPVTPSPLTEDELKKKSKSAIVEYFGLRDMKEAAQCVEDLKNPMFHPIMVSVWVMEALDMKDPERELLVKLLTFICKERQPPLLTHDHVSKGFDLILSVLEDTTVDVPRAPEYVAAMFGLLIIAGVFTLAQVGQMLKDGGMDPGSLVEIGDGLNMFGVLLDTIRREKGDAAMVDLYRVSKLNMEDFLATEDRRKGEKFELFLEKKNLQSLYPMIPLENYLREALDRDEPVSEILKWVENNVPQATSSAPEFLQMFMTQVLRHSVPLNASGNVEASELEKSLEAKIKKFSLLLKKGPQINQRSLGAVQRQYIVAVQLFANDLGHPPGLITALFNLLYREDVINEQAFVKWKDDVKDSTPGRDKAIKETFNWFSWLAEAPEEGEDDDE